MDPLRAPLCRIKNRLLFRYRNLGPRRAEHGGSSSRPEGVPRRLLQRARHVPPAPKHGGDGEMGLPALGLAVDTPAESEARLGRHLLEHIGQGLVKGPSLSVTPVLGLAEVYDVVGPPEPPAD